MSAGDAFEYGQACFRSLVVGRCIIIVIRPAVILLVVATCRHVFNLNRFVKLFVIKPNTAMDFDGLRI